ncbi:MAG: M23 family metallopeptidase [Bacteroidales bacterium]|nr:M23 family metallopeptidase [Lachnoclostridium sp.]MCM1383715.1 M23 family metallopeptidase [Lachnoclostridium sp.]MCM1464343.1 M23 family metallopeptidase [Bacteroidales bacterium]
MAKKITKYFKIIQFTYVKMTLLTLLLCTLFVDGYTGYQKTGDNYFHIKINGEPVGITADAERAEELFVVARKNIAMQSEELTFIDAELVVEGEEVLFGKVDDEESILSRMEKVLQKNVQETLHRSYTMKVNEYMVNLASIEEVQSLLQAAVGKYDTEGKFAVSLRYDSEREFNVLTASIEDSGLKDGDSYENAASINGGAEAVFFPKEQKVEVTGEMDFEDYDLGIKEMHFSEQVEIVEAYLPESQLTPLEAAIDEVIKEQETPGVYEVVSGDTLSEIAIKVNIPMDKIIEMNNETLENENSTIRAGDKLIITVPQPELSVERMEENYYDEIYDAPTVYVDNNNWYTTQTKVLQQPSAGFRKIVADVYFVNDKEVSREILKEEIVQEAVARVVERGTKIPLTYIYPVSGGKLTSRFGYRPKPNAKGATSNHGGVDWAVPTGTAVFASCSGTVSKAGWVGTYGYAVYINHEDGSQTRYAHLSRVLVKVGQKVKQGERIALSGNTGASTGPHVHFEIWINGSRVDPLKHL